MKWILAIPAAAVALTGCTIHMPETEYLDISSVIAVASVCKREKMVTADQFNNLVAFEMHTRPSYYLYDPRKLSAMVQASIRRSRAEQITDELRPKLELGCAEVAGAADRVNPANRPAPPPEVAGYTPLYSPNYAHCMNSNDYSNCSSYR